jgi:hypothetical protein
VGGGVDRANHLDPTDRYLAGFRVASFALGAAVLIDAMVAHSGAVQWVSGLILVGIVPPEAVARQFRRRRNGT